MYSDSKYCTIKVGFVSCVTAFVKKTCLRISKLKTKIDNTKHYFKAYKIHTSEAFQAAVGKVGGFRFEMRGSIQVKVRYYMIPKSSH